MRMLLRFAYIVGFTVLLYMGHVYPTNVHFDSGSNAWIADPIPVHFEYPVNVFICTTTPSKLQVRLPFLKGGPCLYYLYGCCHRSGSGIRLQCHDRPNTRLEFRNDYRGNGAARVYHRRLYVCYRYVPRKNQHSKRLLECE